MACKPRETSQGTIHELNEVPDLDSIQDLDLRLDLDSQKDMPQPHAFLFDRPNLEPLDTKAGLGELKKLIIVFMIKILGFRWI